MMEKGGKMKAHLKVCKRCGEPVQRVITCSFSKNFSGVAVASVVRPLVMLLFPSNGLLHGQTAKYDEWLQG